MADREWFQIEDERGRTVGRTHTSFTNREAAEKEAREILADRTEGALDIVRCTAVKVAVLTKTVTVTAEAVPRPA